MGEMLNGWKRTQYCADISKEDLGHEVVLMGWVNSRRDLGALVFVTLRDRSGIVQVVFNSSKLNASQFEKAQQIRLEYVLAVKGILAERTPDMVNPKMATGSYEVSVAEFKILSEAEPLPIELNEQLLTNEQQRLKYRYLDLRRAPMQENLRLRHEVARITRDYFSKQGFIEIETPMLTKSTPEGARDFLVPSRVHPGSFYALPQSPQQFKQLLMLSGFDKYMQIVRCFRDEDLRADRQPEFTQIDLEMSFVDEEDIFSINEGFLVQLFKEAMGIEITAPLPRLTYFEAMTRYGSDKPDTRFAMELEDISDIVRDSSFKVFTLAIEAGGSVRCIVVKNGALQLSRREIDMYAEYVKTYKAKGLAWLSVKAEGLQSSFAKFMSEEQLSSILKKTKAETGDLLFFVADTNNIVFAALGALRLELAKKLNIIPKGRYELLWVTDFPLLEWDEEENRYFAMHHPFTHPRFEDIEKLESNPGEVRARAYDIILNGAEIGGGSIRIHTAPLQERMFKALGFSKEEAWSRFGFLMSAFKYGTPPHGGIAYGLDRLVMLLSGASSIRDVIAFPKLQNAICPMTGAPGVVDEAQLKELHLRLDE